MTNWSPGYTIDQMEKEMILKALPFYNGDKNVTSQSLGITRRTLDNKLERYAVEEKYQSEVDSRRKAQNEEFQTRSRGLMPGRDGYALYIDNVPSILKTEKIEEPVVDKNITKLKK